MISYNFQSNFLQILILVVISDLNHYKFQMPNKEAIHKDFFHENAMTMFNLISFQHNWMICNKKL